MQYLSSFPLSLLLNILKSSISTLGDVIESILKLQLYSPEAYFNICFNTFVISLTVLGDKSCNKSSIKSLKLYFFNFLNVTPLNLGFKCLLIL